MNNFDLEKIGKTVDDIERYLRDLNELNVGKEEDLANKDRFYAASMITFSIMNRSIDLGNEIVSACKFGMPSSYRDIFEILCREDVVDKEVRGKMIKLVYYRNLIAHEYHRINEKELFTMVKEIEIAERFMEQTREFVREKIKDQIVYIYNPKL